MAKRPDPQDVEVGRKLRAFRMARGLSQEAVGDHLGLTFQQVQKYEKGTNRIAPSRLIPLAKLLRVSPASFFPSSNDDKMIDPRLNTRHRIEIVESIDDINDLRLEKTLSVLLKLIAKRGDPASA